MDTEMSDVVANAVAVVLEHVSPEYREACQGILTSVVAAQYTAGYSAGFKVAIDTLGKAIAS
jgi:hypothetical protein